MRTVHIAVVLCSALAGFSIAATATLAQQKTVKACEDEWRANRTANQAAGITEKAYVDTCRGGNAPAPAANIAAAPTATATPAPQKTVKACEDEWRANRTANQAAGITEKAYVDTCRGGNTQAPAAKTAAAPTNAPAKPAAAAPAPAAPAAPAPHRASAPAAAAPTALTGANQYSNEGQAKAHCAGNDIVVWANLDSKIYHFGGNKDYGNTKQGAYMCERDALGQGIRAAKNEKHP